MPYSYPSDGIFNLHRRTIMDSFSCILILRQLHLDLNMCCFIKLIKSRQVRYGSSLIRWRRNVWRKLPYNDVKTSKSSYWRKARESSYTPQVRRHFLAPVGFTEIPVGYARNTFQFPCLRQSRMNHQTPSCPFLDVIFPSLLLSSSSSCSFPCPMQNCLCHARGFWEVAIPSVSASSW